MTILTQNSKMKKSSANGIEVYNFGIPAFQAKDGLKTCPQAGRCATGCYARSGTYRFSNVAKAYEARLELTQSDRFVPSMVAEIGYKANKASIKGNHCIIRIHDSGDFYNVSYWDKWRIIMTQVPYVKYYAYTKMIQFFNDRKAHRPLNFTLIYSLGGKQDHLIDLQTDRHSKVFESTEALLAEGYADASHDDMVALGPNPKIGLVYHGTKKFTNTKWG